jgi:hypothetical protein
MSKDRLKKLRTALSLFGIMLFNHAEVLSNTLFAAA